MSSPAADARPYLSICVPSRNRQRYLKDLLAYLIENHRPDVEFVIADNSDDPTIMAAHLASLADPRIRFLPSPTVTLPMIENWERTVAAARGQWVSVIGDDDLIDPDVVDAIRIAADLKPGLQVLSWNMLNWDWRDGDSKPANVMVPLSTGFVDLPRDWLFARAFGWEAASAKLSCGSSLYHSAISGELLATIRKRFGGRIFTHPTVDYDSAFKIISTGKAFAFVARPFSIFGTCKESNTAATHSLAAFRIAHATFASELGRNFDEDPWMADFPFPSALGLTAAIGQVQRYFAHVHKIGAQNWEAKFARACAENCGFFRDREEFEIVSEGYRSAFAHWHSGRYLADFNPVYQPLQQGAPFTGVIDRNLYVDCNIGNAVSPADFYRIINAMLVAAKDLKPVLGKV